MSKTSPHQHPQEMTHSAFGLCLFLAVWTAMQVGVWAGELKTFPQATLQASSHNDGDSFRVDLGDRKCILRLYFVDCPETRADSKADARRLREQMRHFGVEAKPLTEYAQQASQFTEDALAEPFTVHTAFATAGGRAKTPRYYAFVTTAEGKDLGTELVRHGLARNHGLGRAMPDGPDRDEAKAQLGDIEVSATIRRAGIWKKSDAERIVKLRAEQRRDDSELGKVRTSTRHKVTAANPVNINKATEKELQQLTGIGPVLAKRIIEARPFKTTDELKDIHGIAQKTLDRLRDQITVNDTPKK